MKSDNYSARTRESFARNQEIARTILEQLGGPMFTLMTGACNLVALDSGLQFNLSSAKHGINKVRVDLTCHDDYKVTFYRVYPRNVINPCQEISSASGIYCEQLQDCFEHHTGLFVTLRARS